MKEFVAHSLLPPSLQLERAYEQFIEPLERFRREQIGAVKERKKKFEKQTAKFCASQERYLGLSTKKQDTVLQEVGRRKERYSINQKFGCLHDDCTH